MLKLKTREGFSIARASRASENIWLECPSTVFKEGSKCICLQCHVMSRRKSSNSNLFLTASTTTITARLRAWALQGNCDSIPLVCRLKCWSSRMFWGLTKAELAKGLPVDASWPKSPKREFALWKLVADIWAAPWSLMNYKCSSARCVCQPERYWFEIYLSNWKVDFNGSGALEFEEFLRLMCGPERSFFDSLHFHNHDHKIFQKGHLELRDVLAT